MQYFPESIIPEKRKRRAYISSILAKNEINRRDVYNRKLFLRVRRGNYILNPGILIKVNDSWIELFKFLNIEDIKEKLISFKELFLLPDDAKLSPEHTESTVS